MRIQATNNLNQNNHKKTSFKAIQINYSLVNSEDLQNVLNYARKNNLLRTGSLRQNLYYFITTNFNGKTEKIFLSLLEHVKSATQVPNKLAVDAIKEYSHVYPIQKRNKWID